MTKREVKKHKAEWIAALKEGRVVKYGDLGMKSFATPELAQAETVKFPGAVINMPTPEYWNNYAGGIYR